MRYHQLVLIVMLSAVAGGCVRAKASTEPVMPMLSPPPPPPRVVETYVDEPVPTVEPKPGDLALTTPPSRPAPRPPVTRPEPSKAEPARSEPERPTTNAPALTLKPAPGAEAKTEASIRALVTRAAGNLQRVKYAALDADGRAQFDTCQRFIQQAEEALKSGNLSFAGKLADKAATMAAVLVR